MFSSRIKFFSCCFTLEKSLKLPKRYFSSVNEENIFAGPYNFIHGLRVSSDDSQSNMDVYNPATGDTFGKMPLSSVKDINIAVKSSREAFELWSEISGFERGKFLSKLGQLISENLEALAVLEVKNNGKPIWEARLDIQSCADCFLFYGGVAGTICGEHSQLSKGSFGLVKREPLGVIAGIGAWNYPMQSCSWKVAPALACGNSIVYKPSELTPLTTIALAELAVEAGIPSGVLNVIQGDGETGAHLCRHQDIAKISFTGSVPTGRKIMNLASHNIKRITLELGGKNPLIIYDDCDVVQAVKGALLANFLSQGQVCSNGTRIFVHKSILKPFVREFVKATSKLTIGDPLNEETKVGASITKAHAERVLNYIDVATCEGAKKECGGYRVHLPEPFDKGYFVSPCILSNCHDEMQIVQEEIFGPVASILPFRYEEEVIQRANHTPYGLSAGIFTRDLKKAHRTADKLQSGIIWINNFNVSKVELPFGGFKQSGIGRECSAETVHYYTQSKSVYIEMNEIDCPLYQP